MAVSNVSTGPVPMLHNITVTLASDPRVDTLLAQVAAANDKIDGLFAQGADSRLRVESVLAEMVALQGRFSEVLHVLRRIVQMESQEMVKIADLQKAVEDETSVTNSVVTLVGDLAAKLQEALDNGSDAEIQAVIDQMNANKEKLAAAVSANAPAPEPAPAPTPIPGPTPDVPVEPAPEPLPDTPAEPTA